VTEALTLDAFSPHVGTGFRLKLDDAALDLVLEDATAGVVIEGPRGTSSSFSLTFRGPAQPILPQRIYHLEHPALDQLDIFLVPVGADAAGVTYEAVFA
jgi:hypothetical protein